MTTYTDYVSILTMVLFAIAFLLTALLGHAYSAKEKSAHEIVQTMTLDAVFIAIILIMTFVPYMGYIAVTPFLSFTLLHLPVLLGAALGGWKKGALLGLVFGLSSYMQALNGAAGFNALFAYPWVAIPPRFLFGLVAGIVFSLLGKISQKKAIGLYLGLACAVLTALHTVLVFLDLYACYPETIAGLFASSNPIAQGTTLTFLLVIAFGMLGEMGIAAIIIPPLYLAVSRALPRLRKPRRLR